LTRCSEHGFVRASLIYIITIIITWKRLAGSLSKASTEKYRRTSSYVSKIEALREQEEQHAEEMNSARLSITVRLIVCSQCSFIL